MGSPVVAILGLVLGYTFVYAGIKNLSIVKAFQGIEAPNTSNPTAGSQDVLPVITGIGAGLGAAGTQLSQPSPVPQTGVRGTAVKAQ